MTDISTTVEDNSSDATLDPISTTDQQTANDDNLQAQESNESTQGSTEEATAQSAPQLDEDIDEWIAKRGFKAETEEEKISYQQLRDEQREFTRERQAAKDIENAKKLGEEMHSMHPQLEDNEEYEDPLEQKLNSLERKLEEAQTSRLQSEFYSSNKVTSDEHEAMLAIFSEKINVAKTPQEKALAFQYWSNPSSLPDLLALAKAKIVLSTDMTSVRDEAAQQERERIAKESSATSPNRGARIISTTSEKTEDEKRLERFSTWD